jgi:hypothetical protein
MYTVMLLYAPLYHLLLVPNITMSLQIIIVFLYHRITNNGLAGGPVHLYMFTYKYRHLCKMLISVDMTDDSNMTD